MDPTLTWIDLTANDRDKMRRVLDLFSEQGTVDEMGLGSLRDTVSDTLFPGTSYIHTRLRYLLFIPWLYKRLEEKRVGGAAVAQAARKAEIGLIDPLTRDPQAKGVIGVQARGALARLPSHVYWSALRRWGIFQHPQSQGWYHTRFGRLVDGADGVGRTDDPGVVWTRQPNWHPRLPAAPASFPRVASFALTYEEADFLRGRLEERCAGTLLAWLARNGSDTPSDSFWDDSNVEDAPGSICATVELARRFSIHVEGMPLLYNLLVAQLCLADQGANDGTSIDERRAGSSERVRPEAIIDEYREKLTEWVARESCEYPFKPDTLWDLVIRRGGRLPNPQRFFVGRWSQRIAELGSDLERRPDVVADDPLLRSLVKQRERQLKGPRARLANRSRRLDWRPGVGVGRMDFRWVRVRQFMMDLRRGLAA